MEALPPEADAPAPRLAAAEPFLVAGEAGAGEGLAAVGAGAGAAAAALSDEGSARPEGLEVGGAAEWCKKDHRGGTCQSYGAGFRKGKLMNRETADGGGVRGSVQECSREGARRDRYAGICAFAAPYGL